MGGKAEPKVQVGRRIEKTTTGEIGWDPPDLKILSNLDNLERLWKSKIIIWEDLGTELLWNCFFWIVLGVTYMTFLEGLTRKKRDYETLHLLRECC